MKRIAARASLFYSMLCLSLGYSKKISKAMTPTPKRIMTNCSKDLKTLTS